jgi:hypothetical protein
MKKIVLLGLFMFAFATITYSQISYRLGVKGGFNNADATTKGGYNISSYKGFLFGAYTELTKANLENLFLRGSVIYSKRGLKYNNSLTTNQYIEVPIQIGYKLPATSFMKIYALAGPSVHFRTYGNENMKGFSTGSKWYTKKVVAGAEGAIGLEFWKHLQLEIGYQYGLTPDYKSSEYEAKNNTLQFSVGLIF